MDPSVFFMMDLDWWLLSCPLHVVLLLATQLAALKPEMRPSPFHHLSKHLPSKQIPLKMDRISANVFSEGGTVQCLCSEKFP